MNKEHQDLHQMLEQGLFERFIRHIRFPAYKNLTPGLSIEFLHPITAIVGPNGTNKSSILRAIEGAPRKSNLGRFWFSTEVDSIDDVNGERPCFIHGYKNAASGEVIEVLKMRIQNGDDPDYWESAPPRKKYDMKPMPTLRPGRPARDLGRTATRWNPIEKDVVYLDFRSELSAYDKYFFHTPAGGSAASPRDKKSFIRKRSRLVKAVLDAMADEWWWYSEDRIVEPAVMLSAPELADVGYILGREYESIQTVGHTFFECEGSTAMMRSGKLRYSEAFAGSGEFSVVRLVSQLHKAPGKSLILLDEPEVSLHPGAQERLMDVVIKITKGKQLQVVMATHSPALIRNLPPEAIKVLYVTSDGKLDLVSQENLAEEAFFHLGVAPSGKTKVVCEDSLAEEFVKAALRTVGKGVRSAIDVIHVPGGSSVIWDRHIVPSALENRTDILFLLDGDQKPSQRIRDVADIADSGLSSAIKALSGANLRIPTDSRSSIQENEIRRKIIRWSKDHVSYLPGETPEGLLLKLEADPDPDRDVKSKWVERTRRDLGLAEGENPRSADILGTEQRALAKAATTNTGRETLNEILHSITDSLMPG